MGEVQIAGEEEGYVAFLGSVTADQTDEAWVTTVRVNNLNCAFKIDSGADVTVLPDSGYQVIAQRPKLLPTQIKLYGAGMTPLTVKG